MFKLHETASSSRRDAYVAQYHVGQRTNPIVTK